MTTDRWVVIQNTELVGFAAAAGGYFAWRLAVNSGIPQAAARRLATALAAAPRWLPFRRPAHAFARWLAGRTSLIGSLSRGALVLMSGVSLGAWAWVIHRFYWLEWRLARLHHPDQPEIAGWYVEHGDWLGLPVIIVCAGYALHLEPVCRQLAGARWFVLPLAYALALAILGFWLGYPSV